MPFKYQTEKWQEQRRDNKSNGRYYRVRVTQDLWANWVVTKIWGGKYRRGGQAATIICATYEEAIKFMLETVQRKKCRGYE